MTDPVTDPVTEEFNRRCRHGDRALLGAVDQARAALPPEAHHAYGGWLLPRPLFAAARETHRAAADLAALLDLMVDMPRRLFGGDMAAYCEHVGIDARKAALMTRFPLPPDTYARADLYHDGSGFKLLEMNYGSSLGGTDRAEVARAHLAADGFAAFAAEHGLEAVHTGAHIARTLRDAAAPVTGGAPPVVGFVEWEGLSSGYMGVMRAFQRMLGDQGVEVLLGEIGDVTDPGGRLRLHGRPVDLVLRYFTENEITAHPRGEELVEPVFRAHEEGRTVLWTTLESALFNNKAVLGALSDAPMRTAMSEEERRLVDRILPWTRPLTADLVDHCTTEQDDLILKPSFGFGGKGIVPGWQTTPQDWKNALTDAAGPTGATAPCVVQRRITPRPEPVIDPATGTTRNWHATYGLFLTPHGYGGTYVRALPEEVDGVVEHGADAMRTTGLLEFGQPEFGEPESGEKETAP